MEQTHRGHLEEILNSLRNAKRVYRDQAADAILRQPELLPYLLEYLFSQNSSYRIKSAWTLELVCLAEIRLLLPYLVEFASALTHVKDESAIRPLSKVCSMICHHCHMHPCETIDRDSVWRNKMIEASFEWLTGHHKVAAQVFAMDSLFLLGLDSDWIQDELYSILDKDYPNKSAGYQSRARKIMDKISTAKGKKD